MTAQIALSGLLRHVGLVSLYSVAKLLDLHKVKYATCTQDQTEKIDTCTIAENSLV
jgi:hypothetical protein